MAAKTVTVVLDFDGTLTPKTGSLFEHVDRCALSAESLAVSRQMREKYLERMKSRRLTLQEELDWLEDSLKLYVQDGVTDRQVQEALAGVRLRDGVVKCLQTLKKIGVPVAIVSYGVLQFIETVLGNNGALDLVDAIYAAHMLQDDSGLGHYIGYRSDTLVVPGNKDQWSRRFAEICGRPFKKQLAIGDSGADKRLGPCKANRFGLADSFDEAERLCEFMNSVSVSQDFDATALLLLRNIMLRD